MISASGSGRMSLIAVVVTGATAAILFNILPVFLGQAAEHYALSDSAIGWLGAIYFSGFGVSSVGAAFWLHRVSRKMIAGCTYSAAALLLLFGSTLESFPQFALVMFAVGFVLGVLYTLSFVLAGEFQDSTRAVGIKFGGEVALGAVLLLILPTFIYPMFGFRGVLIALALLIALPCVRFVSSASPGAQRSSSVGPSKGAWVSRAALIGLVALFVFTAGQSALWSFVERGGVRAGYDSSFIATALSVAKVMGGLGSFTAAAISVRFGLLKPLLFAVAVYILSMLVFIFGQGFSFYAIAVVLFFFIWLFALPYFVSAVTRFDADGRAISLITACIVFGSMLGSASAGQLVRGADFGNLYLAAIVATLTAYALIAGLACTTSEETPVTSIE